MDGMPPIQKYWVMARPDLLNQRMKCVGPHELDQIRTWVSEEILPPEVLIRKDGDTKWIKAKDLPDWCDFSTELCTRLQNQRRKDKEQDSIDSTSELMSAFQFDCLTFMQIPFDKQKVLTSYRAERLIRRFAEIDPGYYHEYLCRKGDRPNTPQKIQQGFPGLTTRGSSGNVIAAIASFFIPGLGQLVQGRIIFALICFAIIAFLWLMTFVSLGILSPVALGVHILLSIAACIDAAQWNEGP